MQDVRGDVVIKAESIVKSIVEALVDRPDLAIITIEKASSILLIRITVEKSETGKMIGRGGRNASAIRAILGAFGARYKLKSIVEINEDFKE
jgi:predicted RNA-binding protein YlqC (UPF0109 family)